jgi:hypothetical protein
VRPNAIGQFPLTATVSATADPNLDDDSFSDLLTVLPPPALSFRSGDSGGAPTEIAWPAVNSAVVLEQTTSLLPPVVWESTELPSLEGGTFRLRIVANEQARFFRLRLADEP